MLRSLVDLTSEGVSGSAGSDCDQKRSNREKHDAEIREGDSFHILYSLTSERRTE